MPVTILQSWKNSWDNFCECGAFFNITLPAALLMSHTRLTLFVGCRYLQPVSRSVLRWVILKRQCVSVRRHLRLCFIQNQKENVKAFTFTGSHVRFKLVSGQTRATIRSRCVVANVLTRVASWETFVYICVVQKLKLMVCVQRSQQLSAGDRPVKWKTEALWGLQMS